MDDQLNSWKEIATYLNRAVRTVHRWEQSEGLPVHRIQHTNGASVHAYRSELDAWMRERSAGPATKDASVLERELSAGWVYCGVATFFLMLSLVWIIGHGHFEIRLGPASYVSASGGSQK